MSGDLKGTLTPGATSFLPGPAAFVAHGAEMIASSELELPPGECRFISSIPITFATQLESVRGVRSSGLSCGKRYVMMSIRSPK